MKFVLHEWTRTIKRIIRKMLGKKLYRKVIAIRAESALQTSNINLYPKHKSDFSPVDFEAKILILGTCNTDAIFFGSQGLFQQSKQLIWDSYLHNDLPSLPNGNFNPDVVYFQLTLRHVLESCIENSHGIMSWVTESEATFHKALNVIEAILNRISNFDTDSCKIVGSFLLPSSSLSGPHKAILDESSAANFVANLNRHIVQKCRELNIYFLDVNEMANEIGRRHVVDEIVNGVVHSSTLASDEYSNRSKRFTESRDPVEMYDAYPRTLEYGQLVAAKLKKIFIYSKKIKPVKLIIIDLDDTIWRGVYSEDDLNAVERTEGWPLGFIEALLLFKQNGGLLAICSKNDELPTRKYFEKVWRGRIKFEDFISVKINFEPKHISVRNIIKEANVLAENVLFIDDNPREIDLVKASIPNIRTMSNQHYDWRRTILDNPEFFMNEQSVESANRTVLVQNSIARDKSKTDEMSKLEWLQSLQLKVEIKQLISDKDPNFLRVFELINKTNQFNLNGRRITNSDFIQIIQQKTVKIFYLQLEDRFGSHGVVSALIIRESEISTFVLSCRAFGLEVENVFLKTVCERLGKSVETIKFEYQPTAQNFAFSNFLQRIKNEGASFDITNFPIIIS